MCGSMKKVECGRTAKKEEEHRCGTTKMQKGGGASLVVDSGTVLEFQFKDLSFVQIVCGVL